jgi:lipopolysaccharide transport system permease protein
MGPTEATESASANVAAAELQSAPTITEIRPPRSLELRASELWAFRDLLYFLVWRDLKVRYAQTVMGAAWAIIQPLLTMVVFTIIFGMFAKVPSDGVPYPVFSLAALVPWTYFSVAFSTSSASLVTNTNLITKIYFPRLVIPLAPVAAGLVDFAIALVILAAAMLLYGIAPSPVAIVVIPLLIAIMAVAAAGVGCLLAALNIQFRDVKYITPFLIQTWMYASPIVYPMSLVPERFRPFYMLNPMAGVIEGFRAVLLGTGPIPWMAIGIAAGVSALVFLAGVYYFRRTERLFADVA